ncbi:MAG: lysyl oxidase family protein [Candidatus Promineifilaceae bacterium]
MNEEPTGLEEETGTRLPRLPLAALIALLLVAAVALGYASRQPAEAPGPTTVPGALTSLPGLPDATEALGPTQAAAETAAPPASRAATDEPPAAESPAETAEPAETFTPTPPPTYPEGPPPPGALIAVAMDSRVGVLLDEIPADQRDRVAEALLERPAAFWQALAGRQVTLTQRRLTFRDFVYQRLKLQLPLPPEALWRIELDEDGPRRRIIQGHELVTISYRFSSILLTDAASAAQSEPALAEVGGRWDEPFVLPLDPDLLYQRTGIACLNEAGFPPNSYDSENAWVFYDHTCEANSGGLSGCHRLIMPELSCLEALDAAVGSVETAVQFERLAWDDALADQVRLGEVSVADRPDLKVVGSELENQRVIYRYFPPESCAIVEACVAAPGWRRLLQFDAMVHNVGGAPMQVGLVAAEDEAHNLFQFNACHNHFHFNGYGTFNFGDAAETLASKQAFCVESTSRLSNNEWSPLTHAYSCLFQGVQAGWVDEYHAGLDCQWIDITDAELPAAAGHVELGFVSNPDQFLCEGTPVLDIFGNRRWEPSGQTTADGQPIDRPMCEFTPDWDANNVDARQISVRPTGSFVTQPCADDVLGPLRNCGFSEAPEPAPSCAPGEAVRLSCQVEGDAPRPQVVRVCEYSQALGAGVACAFEDALDNRIVGPEATLSFTCPAARDGDEPGGRYSLYFAPVFPADPAQAVSCTAE